MTQTEVQRGSNKDRLKREATRMNDVAFPGQRYAVETVDASTFAIVLFDGKAMADNPVLTYRRDPRPRFTARDFTALSGTRSRGKMRGSYRTFA